MTGGQLADLELCHRRRARCEDRIRAAKDTGLRNLPERCTGSLRTKSGARSSPWPVNCWPGRSCSPDRFRPLLGAQAAAATDLLRRRAPRPRRPSPPAPPRRQLAMGPADRHRDHPPAGPHARLTSPNRPTHKERSHQGPWNPAHPARQPGYQARPDTEKQRPTRLRSPGQDHERSWLDRATTRKDSASARNLGQSRMGRRESRRIMAARRTPY
jgi:hypothetical protein